MSSFRPNASWITTTPCHGPGAAPAGGTARYPRVVRSATWYEIAGMRQTLSYLAPLRYPGTVGHRVVPEQRRRLGPHQLSDLAEHQADLLLGAGVGPRLDRVPQGPDVRRPQQAGGHPVRREPAHERGLVLLLMERDAFVVQPEVPGHPALELLHLLQQRGGPLHQLGVGLRPLGEPEWDVGQPHEPQRLLRDRGPRPMANQLVSQNPGCVMQHEAEADVLEHGPVHLLQDVLQVRLLVVAHPDDVRVPPRLPRPVADFAGELDQVLGVVEVAPVQLLQPLLPADLVQVRGDLVVVDLGTGDEEHLGLHALHDTAPYCGPATAARRRGLAGPARASAWRCG